jgi:hypothetical protein
MKTINETCEQNYNSFNCWSSYFVVSTVLQTVKCKRQNCMDTSIRTKKVLYTTSIQINWSGRPARPRTQHGYHHDTQVKPEAATAVIELLMMDGKTPETCWTVNKRQDNKLGNCCIWLVIYLNFTMMHELTNLKKLYTTLPMARAIFVVITICST